MIIVSSFLIFFLCLFFLYNLVYIIIISTLIVSRFFLLVKLWACVKKSARLNLNQILRSNKVRVVLAVREMSPQNTRIMSPFFLRFIRSSWTKVDFPVLTFKLPRHKCHSSLQVMRRDYRHCRNNRSQRGQTADILYERQISWIFIVKNEFFVFPAHVSKIRHFVYKYRKDRPSG